MIRNIESLSDEEINQITQSNPVLFLGSSISTFSPTNLSSGELFCKNLYDYVFGIDNLGTSLPHWLRLEIGNVPFEAIMECFPSKGKLPNILNSIYRIYKYNDLHLCFAKLLSESRVSSIITPNYDLALDAALNNYGFKNVIRDDHDYKHFLESSDKRTYFKIHGTSELNYEHTLIYTLSQEGTLLKWKKDLLEEILRDKILIIAGYSGRDFDICPLIAELNVHKKILWLKYKGGNEKWNEQTAYEEYLLSKNVSNETILGDFTKLLTCIFNQKIFVSYEKTEFDFEEKFKLTLLEKYKWKLNILNRIACVSIGLRLLSSLSDTLEYEYILKITSEMYGHTGEYAKAANTAVQYSKQFPKNSRENLIGLNMASRFWLYYGKFFTAYRYLYFIKKRKARFLTQDKDLDAAILENEITFWQRMKQIISNKVIKKIFFLAHYIIDAKIDKIGKSLSPLKESGNWDERQMIQQNLERLERRQDLELALPAIQGYKNLGLPGMAIISSRHKILNSVWNPETEMLLDECIQKAKYLGMTTELWKLYRLKFKKSDLPVFNKKYIWKRWKVLSKITEFSFIFRCLVRVDLYYHYYFKL